MRKKVIISLVSLFITCLGFYLLYWFKIVPYRQYTNKDFHIKTYISKIDKDNDGIDDQTDILNSARAYVATNPKYKSKYYATGYPNDEYGVCTDVVAFSLLKSGYDLQELVALDIKKHKNDYADDVGDKNIDFRRVRNLKIYFQHTAISLTTNIQDIDAWQGGDIVIFSSHIGIVSNIRNYHGIPFIIHHSGSVQESYEEDILEKRNDIVAHYRIS